MKNTLETRLGIFFALALVVAVVILMGGSGALARHFGGDRIRRSLRRGRESAGLRREGAIDLEIRIGCSSDAGGPRAAWRTA